MINEDNLPNPRPPLKHPPLMDYSFAALGWLYRAAEATGSPRFDEIIVRARFYLTKADRFANTPADRAVLSGMHTSLTALVDADRQARTLLSESVSGMDAAEATEFVELIEAAQEDDPTPL